MSDKQRNLRRVTRTSTHTWRAILEHNYYGRTFHVPLRGTL